MDTLDLFVKQVNCACIVAFFFITILERLHVHLQVSVDRRYTMLNGQDVHSGVVIFIQTFQLSIIQ